MKKLYLCVLLFYCLGKASAQSWNIQGNSGLTTNNFLGTKDNKDLIFKVNSTERGKLIKNGLWQFGKDSNLLKIDSLGKLSFTGSGDYYVHANRYIFRNDVNSKIGLFYNSTGPKLEFRNKNGSALFFVNTSNGNGMFTGTLKIGNYTLPSKDGSIGQVLKTNGHGTLSWSNDNGLNYSAGNEIDIDGGSIAVRDLKTDTFFNTATGQAALYFNTTGRYNVATGYFTLHNNITGNENTANGYFTLNANSEGYANSAFGAYALALNTTGYQNTAAGDGALYHNTTGAANTSEGFGALFFNTEGTFNVAIGNHALQTNTLGNENTAVGDQALFSNSTGLKNVAIGSNALFNNTTASDIIAIGSYALYNQRGDSGTAYGNVAVGSKAMYNNATGNLNTATGFNTLEGNTTGIGNSAFGSYALVGNTTGNYNWASGYFTLSSNNNGTANTGTGTYSLANNTQGNYNTASGYSAIKLNTLGTGNTAQGSFALQTNTTGSDNTAVGYYADVTSSNLNNATAIGFGANVDASNKVRIGNTSVNSIGGIVGWTTLSDGRFKKNIKENVPGLKFINMLKPITYTVDITGLDTYYDKKVKRDSGYESMRKNLQPASEKASAIIHNGFIAQDVEKAAAALHYNFSGVDKPQTTDGLYGLRYSEFVVPIVKAVQELSKMNDDKDARIDSLKTEIGNLKAELEELKAMIVAKESTSDTQQSIVNISSASIEQNVPNPFTNSTSINYFLPQKISSAKIIITDKNGRILQQLNLSTPGKGTIHVNASAMAAGAYNYSLYVDGRLIATKQMMTLK